MSVRWPLWATLALLGCNSTATGYRFHSRAVYEAPRSGSRDAVVTLRTELGATGYAHLDPAELSESAGAIDGVLAGPKATLLGGQTRSLGAVSTRLSRRRPSAPLRASGCGSF